MKRPDPDTTGSLKRVRQLRRDQTDPEQRLWARLRNRQLGGWKFRRQTWIGPFIVDFLAAEIKLIVEVDGDTHAATEQADARRTAFLGTEGFAVLRFGNADIMTNIEGVLEEIMAVARNRPSPSHPAVPGGALPLPQGERGL